MENKTISNKSFSSWAKEIQVQNSEIINSWLNGIDPYKRAMARTILEAVKEG